jgi:hypothetical protein
VHGASDSGFVLFRTARSDAVPLLLMFHTPRNDVGMASRGDSHYSGVLAEHGETGNPFALVKERCSEEQRIQGNLAVACPVR